jgi:hypothetical protein
LSTTVPPSEVFLNVRGNRSGIVGRHDDLWSQYGGMGVGRKGRKRATHRGPLTERRGELGLVVIVRVEKALVTMRDDMWFNMCTRWRHAKDGLVQVSVDFGVSDLSFYSTTKW